VIETAHPTAPPRPSVRRAAVLASAALLVLGGACASKTDTAAPPTTAAPTGSTPNGTAGTTGGSTPGGAGGAGTTGSAPPVSRSATPAGPVPTVSGPVTGGKGAPNAPAPAKLLADAGYVEEEFELAGTATSYAPEGAWAQDGTWGAKPDKEAAFDTRVLVRRPTDPKKFNGTVLVEWMNVTAGADIAVDFGYTNVELLDQGYIYVGVTAQKVGLDATQSSDPERYPKLVHPGDEFSYDLFTQAGRAVLANEVFDSSYPIQKIIASGESQSAGRMTTYINAVQPLTDVYDAFLVHSRFDRMTPVAAGQTAVEGPKIRTDGRAPILVVLTETDVLGNLLSVQDDSDTYRRWEIAGTAHVDNYDLAVLSGTDPHEPAGLGKVCSKPINMAHQWWVMNAGLRGLAAWINGGPAPAKAPRMTIGPDKQYVLDEHGNATGGIRLPDLVVPTATHNGLGNNPSFCRLYGVTTAFDAAKRKALYPTEADYKTKRDAAIDKLLADGFILERDAKDAKAEPATL